MEEFKESKGLLEQIRRYNELAEKMQKEIMNASGIPAKYFKNNDDHFRKPKKIEIFGNTEFIEKFKQNLSK